MIRSLSMGLLAPCVLLVSALPVAAQTRIGDFAQDFPPGSCSDGRSYRLKDFTGKLVVLYFFDPKSPFSRQSVGENNALVKAFKDKPIKFLAVAANATPAEASGFAQQYDFAMPIYGDNLGLMQKRYTITISNKNIYQFRIIGPDGKLVGYIAGKEELEAHLEKCQPKWKFKFKDSDPKLATAIEELEWGQYAQGMKLLATWRKSSNKRASAQAGKIYDVIKKEGAEWKKEADDLAATEPIPAYDLYDRLATLFVGDELAKSSASAEEAQSQQGGHRGAECAESIRQVPGDPGAADAGPEIHGVQAEQELHRALRRHADRGTGRFVESGNRRMKFR